MKEDIQFLKELQEVIRYEDEHDYDCQASPRFWVLMDYRDVPAHEEYNAERTSYHHNDGDHTEFKTTAELKEFLSEYYLEYDEHGGLKEVLSDNDIEFEELWDYVTEHLNEDGYFDEVPVREESYIVPNTMFLTKEEAERHIKNNHYHYTSKVHTYAMTAWRSAKVDRLLKILKDFDWNSVETN